VAGPGARHGVALARHGDQTGARHARRELHVAVEGRRHRHQQRPLELAERGVADHVLKSINGHLSRRMLEHYSHIRIDAKRQALDALDEARRRASGNGNVGNGDSGGHALRRPEPLVPRSCEDRLTRLPFTRVTSSRASGVRAGAGGAVRSERETSSADRDAAKPANASKNRGRCHRAKTTTSQPTHAPANLQDLHLPKKPARPALSCT
jgi:hypothetical protein